MTENTSEWVSEFMGNVNLAATADEKINRITKAIKQQEEGIRSSNLALKDASVFDFVTIQDDIKLSVDIIRQLKTELEKAKIASIRESFDYSKTSLDELLKLSTNYTQVFNLLTSEQKLRLEAIDNEIKKRNDLTKAIEKELVVLTAEEKLQIRLNKLRADFADAEEAAEGDKGILDDYLANLKTKTDASLESDAKIKASGDALMQDINDNFDEKLRKQREVLDAEIKKEQERAAFKEEVEANFKESAINLVNTLFEYSQDKREQEKEAIDAQLQQQLTNETLTQDQRAALTAKAEVEKEKIRKKQNNIAIKQAIFERSLSVVSIIQSTAEAIAKSVALFPLTSGQPWATVAKLNGAVQIASVLTAPIPRYAVGTENSKEGVARVGEQGAELIVDKKYGAWIANKEQHAYLSGGSKVYTAGETAGIMDLVTRNEMINGNNGNTSVQMPFINKLIQANKLQSNEIVSAIKAQKFHIHNQSGINTTVIRKQNNMISQLKG